MEKLIITVAGVGAETTTEAQPGLPVTAAQIGADAARCREAGAAMYHLHVRDAEANPTQAKEVFAAAIEAIRERTDIIIQTSTGGAMGMTADERLQPLELGPEMASLTTGTANFGDEVFFNDTALMSEFYQRMQKKGVRPEFEIFEAGQIDNALRLVKQYGPAGPLLHWDFVLGVPGSMSGEPRNLTFLVDRIPDGSTWTCTGIGRWHMPVTMTALALGGNVRLGFEDNIYLHKGVLAKENAELVARVARLVGGVGPRLRDPRRGAPHPQARRVRRGLTPSGGRASGGPPSPSRRHPPAPRSAASVRTSIRGCSTQVTHHP
jgi:3-keto-5-aminohexanoate cleavage enzyme